MLRFSGSGVSDVGCVRTTNEDSGFVGPYLALVADGVGGAPAGEVASATATQVLVESMLDRLDEQLELLVRSGVESARAALHDEVDRRPTQAGMATTLSLVASDGHRVLVGQLGDSRVYVMAGGALRQATRDHSYVQDLVHDGALSPERADAHPWRHVVTRTVDSHGGPARRQPDLLELALDPGDRILLCTDGLSDVVPEERLRRLLMLPEPEVAAAALTQEALGAGGPDNVTCVVLDVVEGPLSAGRGQWLGAAAERAGAVHARAVPG